uniref:Uncharacterized protein n=1 Tax=Rhizophagus irregularis (strain DAOM 181602 / DAOM 197198 / MUCL 43194) TaxID=747089 RepID=U9THX4_RHIID
MFQKINKSFLEIFLVKYLEERKSVGDISIAGSPELHGGSTTTKVALLPLSDR